MHHYFIGIKIPTHVEDQVKTFREKYQLSNDYKVLPHIEDLHVTLLFLGAVSNQNISLLKQKLIEISGNHSPFSLNIDGLSYFGSATNSRVVYLSIETSSALTALQKEIATDISEQLGMPTSDRFTPHVTIAKKRKTADKSFIEKEKIDAIEIPVQEFSLFAIHPKNSPKYEAVETFTLDI